MFSSEITVQVNMYKSMPRQEASKHAVYIFERFISPSATEQINLNQETAQPIANAVAIKGSWDKVLPLDNLIAVDLTGSGNIASYTF